MTTSTTCQRRARLVGQSRTTRSTAREASWCSTVGGGARAESDRRRREGRDRPGDDAASTSRSAGGSADPGRVWRIPLHRRLWFRGLREAAPRCYLRGLLHPDATAASAKRQDTGLGDVAGDRCSSARLRSTTGLACRMPGRGRAVVRLLVDTTGHVEDASVVVEQSAGAILDSLANRASRGLVFAGPRGGVTRAHAGGTSVGLRGGGPRLLRPIAGLSTDCVDPRTWSEVRRSGKVPRGNAGTRIVGEALVEFAWTPTDARSPAPSDGPGNTLRLVTAARRVVASARFVPARLSGMAVAAACASRRVPTRADGEVRRKLSNDDPMNCPR